MSVHSAPSLSAVMALCVAEIAHSRGLTTVNGCVLIEKPIYANEEDKELNFAVCNDVDVAVQRAKGDCADNVRKRIACANDGGVQCGGGVGCVNFVHLDSDLYWTFKTHPDARMGGCVYMGKDAFGDGDLDVGSLVAYAGVFILERDMEVNVDPTYQVSISGGHKYNGQIIGVDARLFGSLGSRANTADMRVLNGNNVMLDHRYIEGNLLVAVLRATKIVKPGQELLCDYVGTGNVDRNGPMTHTLWRLPSKLEMFERGNEKQLRLYCTGAHDKPKHTATVCMECNWQPVCEGCFDRHCVDPERLKHKRNFLENVAHKRIFGADGSPFGVDYDEAAFLSKLAFMKRK